MNPVNPNSVVVVGAGFAGLSAACHLRSYGLDVTVLEASESAGGRAGARHVDGFRFDTGPTVVTMLELIEEVFAAVDARLDDFCELHALDPIYNANFSDGSDLQLTSDVDEMYERIAEFAGPRDGEGYKQFVEWSTKLFDVEWDTFINRDVRSVLDLAANGKEMAQLLGLGGFSRWFSKTNDFFQDDRLRKLFSFQAMYAGMSPLKALGLFAVIAHMDTVQGVYAPVGGVTSIASGMAAAAEKAGVKIHYGQRVTSIRTASGRPVITTADGTTFNPRAAVVNPDLPIAYSELTELKPPRSLRRGAYSPSCMVWHLTSGGQLPEHTAHHNVHFSKAWGSAFHELLEQGRPMSDPSRFVTVGSISDPTAAPEGRHALFVLEPVPNLDADIDWLTETPRLTDRMLRWAESAGYDATAADVVGTVDPLEWRRQGAGTGTPFSLDHRFSQSGPFRPSPTDRRLPGVVFAGSGTRPGIGIPMVIISGKIAATRVKALLA